MLRGELTRIDFRIFIGIVACLQPILARRQGRQSKLAGWLNPRFRSDCGLAESHDPHVSFPFGGYARDAAANPASLRASNIESFLLFQSNRDWADLRDA